MARFQITNSVSGMDLGTWEAETGSQALDMMARDAGYADYAEAKRVAPSADGEIVVREIDAAAMIHDYATADAIRPATAAEIAAYEATVARLPISEQAAGAVAGDRVAADLTGRVVYVA